MFHHDARNTGYTSAAGHLSNSMSRWDYTLHFWPNGPVAADVDGDGKTEVVVTDGRSWIYCFDGASGTLEWSKRLGTYGYGILVTPAAADVDGDGDVEVAADHGYHVCVLRPAVCPNRGGQG